MRLDESLLKKMVSDAVLVQGQLEGDLFFSVDSRTIQSDELFVPLYGENVDGHTFLAQALEKGKGSFIAYEQKELLSFLPASLLKNKIIIMVRDVKEAFIAIAHAWRMRYTFPVVGITGSIGKTSTKALIATIMMRAGKNYFCAYGNQNTLIGIALNIARLHDKHEGAIFEMGIQKRGEMDPMAALLQPTTAVITYIGHSHMECLGGVAGIAAEKRNIFKYFKDGNIGVINGDQLVLSSVGYAHPVVKFGHKITNQVQVRKIQIIDDHIECVFKIYGEKFSLSVPTVHEGMINNMLAAASVACVLNVPYSVIIDALQEPVVSARRFESCPLKKYQGLMIDDAYNASPESMKAALLAFELLKASGKKIAILGDMLELGQTSSFWHRQLGRFLRKVPTLKHLILVGDQVQWIKQTAPITLDVVHVASWQDAVEKLKEKLDPGSVVLVKGSRGMKLNNLVQEFI